MAKNRTAKLSYRARAEYRRERNERRAREAMHAQNLHCHAGEHRLDTIPSSGEPRGHCSFCGFIPPS